MSIDRSRRITFEEVADLYDEVIPGYPEELVEDVLSLSGIREDGRILEVGCGPGNATVMFARRGYNMLAIELGERLAAHAARHCADFPGVTILNTSFEEWALEASAFDLAISADAFHWIPPEIGYPKVAGALKGSGSAAFFWNVPVDPDNDWSRAMDELYRRRFPGVDNPINRFDLTWLVGIIKENFRASGLFGDVTVREYRIVERLTGEHYLKLLRCYSGHRELDPNTRERLFEGILDLFEQFGGVVEKPRLVALFHAMVIKSK